MSLNLSQLRDHVVVPTLKQLDMYSLAAEQLILGTIAQESSGSYLKQLGGPALGLIQMEPATHKDLWMNFIRYTQNMRDVLLSMTSDTVDECYRVNGWPDHAALIWNLRYAIAMCRVHYYRRPEALPKANDINSLARYWKAYYNTGKGAGQVSEFVKHFPYELYGLTPETAL